MKPFRAALTVAAIILTVPAGASAATLAVSPVKPCYRAGETFNLAGTGYTPGSAVNVTVNGEALKGSLTADPATGNIGAGVTLAQASGQEQKTLVATDATNPALTASTSLLVSAVTVGVKPRNGAAGRIVRITGRGFTTGRTLWAHISRRGRTLRNIRVASLTGPCHRGSAKRRLFAANTPSGTYKVQFDTKRRRSSKTQVKALFNVTIFPMAASSGASAATAAWRRIG